MKILACFTSATDVSLLRLECTSSELSSPNKLVAARYDLRFSPSNLLVKSSNHIFGFRLKMETTNHSDQETPTQ